MRVLTTPQLVYKVPYSRGHYVALALECILLQSNTVPAAGAGSSMASGSIGAGVNSWSGTLSISGSLPTL